MGSVDTGPFLGRILYIKVGSGPRRAVVFFGATRYSSAWTHRTLVATPSKFCSSSTTAFKAALRTLEHMARGW